LITGIDIPRSARIGPGLLLHHYGGVIISPRAVIGANFEGRHGLTIGTSQDYEGVPVIGDDVTVGVNVAILGDVSVGNGAVVGAFSLVLHDVPANSVAFGIPAQTRGR
jgi:serine O-acetyltransferase